ncbi:MAG: ATP-binding protein [Victivallales bacterium]
MIERILYKKIKTRLFKGKAIIVLGPRRVGKTTLLKKIETDIEEKTLFLDGDEPDVRKKLSDVTSSELKKLVGGNKVLMIDEAQRVKNIGVTLKLITDKIPEVQVIATGSSSFELANQIKEPLTGRKYEYHLFPFSEGELVEHNGETEERRLLESRLIYGMYPEVVLPGGGERETLKEFSGSYLYKDVFAFNEIRKPEMIQKLVEALALQIGSEVSINELAQIAGADPLTVERYLNLLENAFVVFRLRAFSRNVRNELKKSRKFYFYDNGIRNAIISNFNSLSLRTDTGALWENFIISERMKYLNYHDIYANCYFWRTTQQQEIDYIEERDGKLHAFEFKWNPNRKVRFPKTFSDAYPGSEMKTINREDIIDWLKR